MSGRRTWATLAAAGALIWSCTSTTGPGIRLAILAGDNQTAFAGTVLPQLLEVLTVPATEGVEVTWSAGNPGASVSRTTTTTDRNGIAAINWTLGSSTGVQTAKASCCSGAEVTFRATVPLLTLRVLAGDGQQGIPGTELPQILRAVTVPISGGLVVNWRVASGDGSVSNMVTTTDLNGVATTTWTLGQHLGTQSAYASCCGGAEAHFDATAAHPGLTWTGAVSSDWDDRLNWQPLQVPTAADNVVIPRGIAQGASWNDPILTAPAAVRDLVCGPGGSLDLVDHELTVNGSLAWCDDSQSSGGLIRLVGSGTLSGWLARSEMEITGIYAIGGPAFPARSTSGPLRILGGQLTVDSHLFIVIGDLTVSGPGARLIMTNDADIVDVNNVVFDGDDTRGMLTAGRLKVGYPSLGGSFTQISSVSPWSFVATGTHVTEIGGGVLRMQSPSQSRFATLWVRSAELQSDASADSLVLSRSDSVLAPTEVALAARQVTMYVNPQFPNRGPALLDKVRLVVNAMAPTDVVALEQVTFRSAAAGGPQLAIRHPGHASPLSFTDLTFAAQPGAGGFYLSAEDSDPGDGSALVVDMVGPTPGVGAPYVQTSGGAVVNWGAFPAPCGGASKMWTGALSNDWFNAGNWTPAGVPSSTDDVCVPAGTPAQPRLTANAAVRTLVGAAGADLSGTADLDIHGNLAWAGSTGNAFGAVRLLGTVGTVEGTMAPLTVVGDYTVTGRVTVATRLNIEPGRLTLNGHTIVAGSLVVGVINALGTGRLVMTNPLDSMLVQGVAPNVTFHGGDETGLLTAGVLRIGGNFTQLVGTTAFVASGTHRTVFTNGTHLVQAFSTQSRFHDLDVSAAGTMNFNSNVVVAGQLIATPLGAAPLLATATNFSLEVGGANVTGLTLSQLRLRINGGTIANFRNVAFVNFLNLGGVRLDVVHAGRAAPFVFDNLTFNDLPPAGGFYLRADDTAPADGVTLTITVTSSIPAAGAPYVQALNGAVVNWP